MIKVENGKVTVNNTGMGLLVDLSCTVAAVYESIVDNGFHSDFAKRSVERAVKIGLMGGAKKAAPDSVESALSELYETLGEILGKAGKDNGSK